MRHNYISASIYRRSTGYHYAAVKVFESVITGGTGEMVKRIVFPEPFIDAKTARKHAAYAAHEMHQRDIEKRKEKESA